MDKKGISRSSLQFQYAHIKRATLERLDMLKTLNESTYTTSDLSPEWRHICSGHVVIECCKEIRPWCLRKYDLFTGDRTSNRQQQWLLQFKSITA